MISNKRLYVAEAGAWQNPDVAFPKLRDAMREYGCRLLWTRTPIEDPKYGFRELAQHLAEFIVSTGAEDVELITHSRAGNYAPWAAEAAPCVTRINYVNAVIPPTKADVAKKLWLPPKYRPLFEGGIYNVDGVTRYDPKTARNTLYNRCSAYIAQLAIDSLLANSKKPEDAVLDHRPIAEELAYYSLHDEAINPAWSQAVSLAYLGRRAHPLNADHCPHLSAPELLAETLCGGKSGVAA